jgi:hypothetical protein
MVGNLDLPPCIGLFGWSLAALWVIKSESKGTAVAEWCASFGFDARDGGRSWLLEKSSGLCD